MCWHGCSSLACRVQPRRLNSLSERPRRAWHQIEILARLPSHRAYLVEPKETDIVRRMDMGEQHTSALFNKQRKDVLGYLHYAAIFSGTCGFTSVVTRISPSITSSPCFLPASLISWSLASASLLDSSSAVLKPLEC